MTSGVRPVRLYRPSSGTEGFDFMERWCGNCAKDKEWSEGKPFDECSKDELRAKGYHDLEIVSLLWGGAPLPQAATTEDADCATCEGDPEVCAKVPGLRHCEKANRADRGTRDG